MKITICSLVSFLVFQSSDGLSPHPMTRSSCFCHTKRNFDCNRSYPSTSKYLPSSKLPSSSSYLQAATNLADESHAITSFLTSAVPVFDGSTIREPVVVSSLYWNNLWHGISTWILTQIIVGAVVSIILVFTTSQVIALGEYISAQTNRWAIMNNRVEDKSQSTDNSSQSNVQPWSINTTIYKRPDRVVKLALCIAIDLLGSISELIPVLGELFDLLWAPIAAYTLRSLYAGSNVIFVLEFIEEILPFSDLIPLATICWIVETYFDDSEVAKALQIGMYARK